MSNTTPADVLVIGGGIAGYTCAITLRDLGYDGAITIVESDASCSDHPPLSKRVLMNGAARADLDLATPERLEELKITVLAGVAAIEITSAGAVMADGRVLTAEAVVVAVGATARRPTMPGADDPRVVTLRDFDDAMRIRAAAGAGRTVLVLGGGFVGAEVAAALRALGTTVILVDPHETPGAYVLGDTLAGWLNVMHVTHGVDLRTTTVSSIDASGDLLAVALANGATVAADLVVAGLGVEPRVLPGVELVEPAGGIVIAASAHWDAARLDGMDAAGSLLGRDPAPRGAEWCWSERYGSHIEIVGDLVGAGVDVIRAGTAVFRVAGDRLLGAASIDDPMTIRAARRIIDRGISVEPSVLADPTVSLRQMLRG